MKTDGTVILIIEVKYRSSFKKEKQLLLGGGEKRETEDLKGQYLLTGIMIFVPSGDRHVHGLKG